jgi:hypothetical protein
MDQTDRFLAALTEEGRYRLLIDAITDYAIFLLDPSGRLGTPALSGSRDIKPMKLLVSTFRGFIPRGPEIWFADAGAGDSQA